MSINAQKLKDLPGNDRCADCQDCDCPECGFPDPVWACEELGILVCEECMDMHRTLTKSTFKSILCQDWTEESYQNMSSTNNNVSKEIYERCLSPAFKKPTRCFNVEFRRQWIISKYIRREFMAPENMPTYTEGKKCGYLWKRGRDGGVFLKRWFVLDPTGKGTLRYYTDANEQTLRGEISLFKMNMALASVEKIRYPNGLQLIFPETKGQNTRMIYLYAELAKDMVEWYQAVRCLKFNIMKAKSVEKDEEIVSRILRYDILKEGYLFKTGTNAKGAFRKRWMLLDPLCLMYFKDPLDANPKGTIPMKAGYSLILSGQLDPENRGYHFYLKTPGRVYHFIAESDHERKAWFQAIHSACNRVSGVGKQKTQIKPPASPSAPRKRTTAQPPVPHQGTTKSAAIARSPPAAGSLSVKEKYSNPELGEEDLKLSSTFLGVRPSTKPRPKETLTDFHHRHAPGHVHGRYQTADMTKQSAVEIVEDHEFNPVDQEITEDTEESSDEEEESPYIELEGENVVMMQKVDIVGMTTKQLSTFLKVPPRALPQSSSCTMCVSLVWNTLPNMPDSEGFVAVCPVVSCCSMPRKMQMLQPFQLEIQHSAILKDAESCQPSVWHLNKEPGKFFKWEKVDSGKYGISCRATHRNFVITSPNTGCFFVMPPQDSVVGKMIRCMTYMSGEQGDDHLVVRVYFFDDNGSDDVLHEIQRRENSFSGLLCDISSSFFLANTQDDILLKLSDFEGMKTYLGSDEPIHISAHELWHKLLVCYIVEIVKTKPVGQCIINVWQDSPSEKQATQMNLHYSHERKFSVVAPMPHMHTPVLPLTSIPTRCHEAVTRVLSEPTSPDKGSSLFIADRSRDNRHARSIPSRTKASDLLPLKGCQQENQLPFLVKRDLFLLLDTKLSSGKDWRMLASQLGLDAMIYSFEMQINPTMEVLKLFEVMNRPIKELEDYLRHMGRDDAADVIKRHMDKSKK